MRVVRPMRAVPAILVAVLLLPGCIRPVDQPTTVDTSGRGAPPGGQPLRFGAIPARPGSPEPGFRVVRSERDWDGGPLSLSFDEAMVMVASAGIPPQGGSTLEIQSVSQVAGEVHVQVLHTLPGEECPMTGAGEWVGQVVAAERVDAPVHFHVVQQQQPPCVDPPVVAFECWAEGNDLRATSLHVPDATTIRCDASASRTDGGQGGPPAGGSWKLLAVPEGSSLSAGEIAQGPRMELAVDAPGPYPIEVSVTDAHGNTSTAQGTVTVGPVAEALEVRVEWDPTTEGASVELPTILKVFRGPRACSLTGRGPPPWCTIEHTGEGPGAGTVARLPADSAAGSFEIIVDYPEGNQPEQAVAQVTVTADGTPVAVIRDTEARQAGYRWQVASVTMPEGAVTPAE